MTHPLPPRIERALAAAADRWAGVAASWLVGGSCGLAFHGVQTLAPPRDVDIYVDAVGAAELHRAMADLAVDEQEYNETPRYRSVLSHYRVEEVTIELVAGFEVRRDGALYRVRIDDVLLPYATERAFGNAKLQVMPLAHEFMFNVLRERPDRYQAIADRMRGADQERHAASLRAIVTSSGRFDCEWLRRLTEYLGFDALLGACAPLEEG